METKSIIPILNEMYNFFDDGKIRESRRDLVIITKITPFEEMKGKTLNNWIEDSTECDWLYAKTTDYFISGHLLDEDEDVVFVRTIDGGWFSLGWLSAGRLDIDGSLAKRLTI